MSAFFPQEEALCPLGRDYGSYLVWNHLQMEMGIVPNQASCFLIATTQDNLDDKLRKFEIRDMMGLTDDRDISETVSETWSTDVLGSDFDPNIDEDRLQEIAGNVHCF